MKIFIFIGIWLILDLILNVISKNYRRNTIRLLKEFDDTMEIYWYSIWRALKNYLKRLFK